MPNKQQNHSLHNVPGDSEQDTNQVEREPYVERFPSASNVVLLNGSKPLLKLTVLQYSYAPNRNIALVVINKPNATGSRVGPQCLVAQFRGPYCVGSAHQFPYAFAVVPRRG